MPTHFIRGTSLKNTKDMGPSCTARPSQGLERRPSIVEPLAASRNTSPGLHSEACVERAFQRRGYRTLERRWRTPFAELDLVFIAPDGGLLIVEVKSSDWPEGMLAGLSRRQRGRLLRAREWLAERDGREVRLWLVTFEAGARLRVMSIF